jgi:hypothetical protein
LSNETILSVVLVGLGLYFAVLLVQGLAGYLHYRRLRPTALLTWPPRRRARGLFFIFFILGLLAPATAVLNWYLARPLHHVVSLGLMALYFMLMVPLTGRIRLGLYQEGVWADAGFLPWGRIARMAFRDDDEEGERRSRSRATAEIMLILVSRGGSGSFRLPVPPDEYGAVRKLIEEKVRARVVNMEGGILGL